MYLTQPGEVGPLLTAMAARLSLRSLGSRTPLQLLVPASEPGEGVDATAALLRALGFRYVDVLNTSQVERPLLERGYGAVSQFGTFRKIAIFQLH